jgi:hypothetical protein
VLPIEVGDGETETAVGELSVEVRLMQEQVGTMQRHAESHSEYTGGHHGDPGTEVSVMYVDVCDILTLEQEGVVNAKPGMQEGFGAPHGTLASMREYSRIETRENGVEVYASECCAKGRTPSQRLKVKRLSCG